MAGIYVHIPYCRKACTYCDFHFSTVLNNKADLLRAIVKEIEFRSDYLKGLKIDSIYFGGGTPSVMTISQTRTLLGLLTRQYDMAEDAEITLEANPDDLDKDYLQGLFDLGINRLSIGIQSFDDEVLQWMNRSHDAVQALECVRLAQEVGIFNISIDLIYGIPGKGKEYWQQQLDQLLQLNVPHVSTYALTVENETVLNNWIRKGITDPPDEEEAHQQFLLGSKWLQNAGFDHYEVSNFAKPGSRAVHNSAYWKSQPYLGLGPSAHSYDGDSRQWNVSNNQLYQSAITAGELSFEREDLSLADRLNERIMTSLRTEEGLNLRAVDEDFGVDFRQHILEEAGSFLEEGRLLIVDDQLVIPQEQRFFSDGIAASLFYI